MHIKETMVKMLSFLLFSLIIIAPITMYENIRYFSLVYLLLFVIIVINAKTFPINIKYMWSFWFFVIVHFVVLIKYYNQISTIINLLTLIVSYLALFLFISKAIKKYGYLEFQDILFKNISILLLFAFLVSPILTFIGWPETVPLFYPWESFYSDIRLLLITGQNVGHSNAMWLMAFSVSFLLAQKYKKNHYKSFIRSFLIIALLFCLVETRSRLALIFVLLLLLSWLCYKNILSKKFFSYIIFLLPILFFVTVSIPNVRENLIITIENIQSNIPFLRISTVDVRGTGTLYSGRDILNGILIGATIDSPWYGVGHSDPRLKFGVNKDGEIDYEDSLVRSESGLRMLAKYGLIYFISLLTFLVTPIIRAAKGYYKDDIFVMTICGMILLSGINGSIFENLYGMSGLFAIIIITFNLCKPYKRKLQKFVM